jgi:hypothetical protein
MKLTEQQRENLKWLGIRHLDYLKAQTVEAIAATRLEVDYMVRNCDKMAVPFSAQNRMLMLNLEDYYNGDLESVINFYK